MPFGRHKCIEENKEHHPAVTSSSGQGLLTRGNERISNGETESPAKRKRIFSNLLKANYSNNNYGINMQSENRQPGSGSNEVRGSYNTGNGDDSTGGDLYMPGGGGG